MEKSLKLLRLEETGFNQFEDKNTGTRFEVPSNRKISLAEAQRLAEEYQVKVSLEDLRTQFYGCTHILFPNDGIR